MAPKNLSAPLLRTVHLLSVCAWIGGGLAIALLLQLDRTATQASDLQAYNRAIDSIDSWIIAPGACATLVSGLTLARYRGIPVMSTRWLQIKLFCTTVAIAFGFFFVARWLEQLYLFSTGDGSLLWDSFLYARAYQIGAVGCAVQAAMILLLMAVSVLRPRFRAHHNDPYR